MNTRRTAAVVAVLAALVQVSWPTPAQEKAKDEAPALAYVVNTGDGTVSLVDLTTMKELRRHKVGPRPYGVAISPDGKTIAVGVEDEKKVKFYSLPDFTLKGEFVVGRMFNDHLVVDQEGKHVLVANFYSDDVVAIDLTTFREAYRIRDCSAPHVVKFGPLRRFAYVTCKKITGIAIIDPSSRKLVRFHQLNVNPRSLTFSPDESRVYFGSFWVNGFFEADTKTGQVTRLFELPPPEGKGAPQEVTYHGVEAVHDNIVLAANEGRSYVDAVDVKSGKLLDRLMGTAKPCCVERVPGTNPPRVLVSNIGDGTLQLVEVSSAGKMKSLGRATVGKAPKRVAFVPTVRARKLGVKAAGAEAPGEKALADRIGKASGATTTVTPDGVVRIGWPRKDVAVKVDGLALQPFAGLGSWAAFTPTKHGAMVMGDTVVFQDEATPAMDAAFAHGLEVTGLHNHFFHDEPKAYFMHIGGSGEPEKLAAGVKAVWDAVKKVRKAAPAPATRFAGKVPAPGGKVDLPAIEKALGHKGEAQGGAVKVTIGREGTMHGVKVGKSMGLTTWMAFSGNDDLAAVGGDFIMTAKEVQPVLRALRKADIHVVAIHNHMVGEEPAFYFTHFWGKGRAVDLARGLKSVLDAQARAGMGGKGH